MKKDDFFKVIPAVGRYFTCREISFGEKILVCGLALLYILSPVDLLPDVIPVIGWLDDIGVGALFLAYCSWRMERVGLADKPKEDAIETSAEVVPPDEPSSAVLLDAPKTKTPPDDLFSAKR